MERQQKKIKKLIILQTTAPDYRKKLFSFLKQELNSNFELYTGDYYFESSVKTDKSIDFAIGVKNRYLLRKKFLYQTGKIWSVVLKDNVVVLELNPRIISNWLILLIRKLLNKKTILWGHAWPRQGMTSKTDKIRHIMRLISDEIIVYTERQKEELSARMGKLKINAAPNALYYRKEMQFEISGDISNIIYVGRLTKTKKPLLLLKAYHEIVNSLPDETKLIIIGEGEEKQDLIAYTREHKLGNRVEIKGHISNYEELQSFYNNSLVSVSPGYAGLSITQSFGFGVPMIISKNENHSPEIEMAEENFNCLYFESNNEKRLGEMLLNLFENNEIWISKREEICNLCKHNYSIEAMGETFLNIVK